MCRNIRTLFNFDPPVTNEEVRAASLQFVRKISGFNKPSKANEASFLAAVDEIDSISSRRSVRSKRTHHQKLSLLPAQVFVWQQGPQKYQREES
jgi:hypothetical protein